MKMYLFKTLMAFLVIRGLVFVFKKNFEKVKSLAKYGLLRVWFNTLIFAAIPIVRWILATLVMIIGFLLEDDEFVEKLLELEEENK